MGRNALKPYVSKRVCGHVLWSIALVVVSMIGIREIMCLEGAPAQSPELIIEIVFVHH